LSAVTSCGTSMEQHWRRSIYLQ